MTDQPKNDDLDKLILMGDEVREVVTGREQTIRILGRSTGKMQELTERFRRLSQSTLYAHKQLVGMNAGLMRLAAEEEERRARARYERALNTGGRIPCQFLSGLPELDVALGGGMPRGKLHEIHGEGPRDRMLLGTPTRHTFMNDMHMSDTLARRNSLELDFSEFEDRMRESLGFPPITHGIRGSSLVCNELVRQQQEQEQSCTN